MCVSFPFTVYYGWAVALSFFYLFGISDFLNYVHNVLISVASTVSLLGPVMTDSDVDDTELLLAVSPASITPETNQRGPDHRQARKWRCLGLTGLSRLSTVAREGKGAPIYLNNKL